MYMEDSSFPFFLGEGGGGGKAAKQPRSEGFHISFWLIANVTTSFPARLFSISPCGGNQHNSWSHAVPMHSPRQCLAASRTPQTKPVQSCLQRGIAGTWLIKGSKTSGGC